MSSIKINCIAIVLLGAAVVFGSLVNEAAAGNSNRRPFGPPPEAYTACEGKAAGDKAEFANPHGDTVTGTCKKQGERLFLVPDNPPPHGRQTDSTKNE